MSDSVTTTHDAREDTSSHLALEPAYNEEHVDESPTSESDELSHSDYDSGDSDDSVDEDEASEAAAWFNFDDVQYEDPFKDCKREISTEKLEWWSEYCENFEPTLELDPDFFVNRSALRKSWYNPPRRVCFGFGFTADRLIRYAVHKGFISSTPSQSEARISYWTTLRHLKDITGLQILDFRDPIHKTHEGILAICSNFTKEVYDRVVPDERKERIIYLIRRELRIPPWEQPMWFFEF